MKRPVKPDPVFEEFLRQEAGEIDQILACLMPRIMGTEEDLIEEFHWTEGDLAKMKEASSMTYEELFGDV